jgi:hypothetical protein
MAKSKSKTVTIPSAKRNRRGCTGCLAILTCFLIAYLVSTGTPRSSNRTTQQGAADVAGQPSAAPTSTPVPTRAGATTGETEQASTIIAGDRPASDVPSVTVTPSATITDTVTVVTLTTQPPTDAPPQTYYTTNNARARECPSTDCDVIVTIRSGTAVAVVDSEEGEVVSQSPIWMRVNHNGAVVYIHATLLSTSRPRPTSPRSRCSNPPSSRFRRRCLSSGFAPATFITVTRFLHELKWQAIGTPAPATRQIWMGTMTGSIVKVSLKSIVENTDTTAGRFFNLSTQMMIVISLILFTIETVPELGEHASFSSWRST